MLSRRAAMRALALAGLGVACRDGAGPATRQIPTLDDLAERYVRLALRLAQHQPSLVESWLGPPAWRPGPRMPVSGIRDEIERARADLAAAPPPAPERARWAYLGGQVEGLFVAARRLSGETMRLADEAAAAFGPAGGPFSAAALASGDEREDEAAALARAELSRRLPGRGPLPARYAAFRRRHAVARERVLPVFRAAVAACRDRLAGAIPLPSGEQVTAAAASGLGLEARARYAGGLRTDVAIDPTGGADLARLVWLAAHETYPGHHLQHVQADRELVEARGWTERQLHPAFGPHVLLAEGAAEAGATWLLADEVFGAACRELAPAAGVDVSAIADLVAVHRAITELDIAIPTIARAYLDGDLSGETAAERLTTEALVADGRAFLFAIEKLRIRVLAYPLGRRLVAREIEQLPRERQWRRLRDISTHLTI